MWKKGLTSDTWLVLVAGAFPSQSMATLFLSFIHHQRKIKPQFWHTQTNMYRRICSMLRRRVDDNYVEPNRIKKKKRKKKKSLGTTHAANSLVIQQRPFLSPYFASHRSIRSIGIEWKSKTENKKPLPPPPPPPGKKTGIILTTIARIEQLKRNTQQYYVHMLRPSCTVEKEKQVSE